MNQHRAYQKIKIGRVMCAFAVFALFAFGVVSQFAFAEAGLELNGLGISVSEGGVGDTPQTAQDYLKNLYNFLLGFVGIAAMGSIVYGGVLYIISAGNPSRVGAAKDAIWNGIIGLVVAGFGYLILVTINPDLVGGFDLKDIVEKNLNKAQQGQ